MLQPQRDWVRMVRPEDLFEEENWEEDEELEVEMANLLKSKGFTNHKGFKRDPSIKCFNCGGMGHYQRGCPSPSINHKQLSPEAKTATDGLKRPVLQHQRLGSHGAS